MVCVIDTDYGWAVEAAVPLKDFGIKLADGALIGFNIKLNDDDDGGDRDHNLGWSNVERADSDSAYRKPSVFGTLKLVSAKN